MQKKIPLICLIAIFILPLIISWLIYYYPTYFHLRTNNHGTLIQPTISLAEHSAEVRTWQIIYLKQANCDQTCENITHQLHQVQKALGKDANRVIVERFNKLNATFAADFVANDKIYLVDPRNNIFMYYPSNVDPLNILKDLKKVLEVSQIG